jgi:hypothetical protein
VAVDAVIYYKIAHPMSAICNIADYSNSTKVPYILAYKLTRKIQFLVTHFENSLM